jgi:hypothetical protein
MFSRPPVDGRNWDVQFRRWCCGHFSVFP